MPGPVVKTPRHKLTAEERRRCIAALSDRHERRMRREEVAEQHAAGGKKTKKASRKKAAKHTTPAMEIAESKGCAASTERVLRSEAAEEKEPTAAHESAEAKETAAGSPETQTPSVTPPTTEHRAPGKERASGCKPPVANLTTSLSAPAHPVVAEVVEVVEDIIEGVANSVLMGVSAALAHSPVSAGTSRPPCKGKQKRSREAVSKKRRRAVLQDESEIDAVSYADCINIPPMTETHIQDID
ncbi:hypothetical protein PR001_g6090 [Phytophthora rubi]|uniref:Uncharacterized protein n=1 Tax=Phytophthora rubi TaxID=129364 RepID=A0A6A3NQF9_9STRA|nr:hypothetical protein PR001_g6090 [Phytophthora rubi]